MLVNDCHLVKVKRRDPISRNHLMTEHITMFVKTIIKLKAKAKKSRNQNGVSDVILVYSLSVLNKFNLVVQPACQWFLKIKNEKQQQHYKETINTVCITNQNLATTKIG